MRLSNIFKTANVTNLTKVILESSYRNYNLNLQYTFKQETLKQPVYFLKVVEFCTSFDIQIDITLHGFRSISQKFTGLPFCGGWTKNSIFQQTFLLRAAFKILHCRVYSYFRVLLIELIQTIFNEMKQQLRRPIISTIVDPYTSIFQL